MGGPAHLEGRAGWKEMQHLHRECCFGWCLAAWRVRRGPVDDQVKQATSLCEQLWRQELLAWCGPAVVAVVLPVCNV